MIVNMYQQSGYKTTTVRQFSFICLEGKMECSSRLVKLAIILFITLKLIVADEIHFDRIELKNTSYNPEVYNISLLRIAKFNRTTYVLNANVDVLADIDSQYYMEVSFFYNRFNNNQYSRSLIRVPRMNLCDAIERFYNELMTEEWENLRIIFKSK